MAENIHFTLLKREQTGHFMIERVLYRFVHISLRTVVVSYDCVCVIIYLIFNMCMLHLCMNTTPYEVCGWKTKLAGKDTCRLRVGYEYWLAGEVLKELHKMYSKFFSTASRVGVRKLWKIVEKKLTAEHALISYIFHITNRLHTNTHSTDTCAVCIHGEDR